MLSVCILYVCDSGVQEGTAANIVCNFVFHILQFALTIIIIIIVMVILLI